MQDQNLKLPTFGADFFGSEEEIKASGQLIEGAVFPDLNVTKDFQKRYREKYGNDIQIAFAANAYDVASTVALNFSAVGSDKLTNREIMEKIRNCAAFKGAHGGFKYENNKDFGPAFVSQIVLRRIVSGHIENLKDLENE